MSEFNGLAAACASLQRYLELSFGELEPVSGKHTTVAVARPEDLSRTALPSFVQRPALTILPYQVDVDPTMRAAFAAAGAGSGRRRPSLALQLHFLVIPWATNADEELRVLGRTMQALEETPIFAGPLLAGPGWGPDETVQIVMQDIEPHNLQRIFDSLQTPYRLSAAYLARILRIAGLPTDAPPVVTAIIGARPSLETSP